MVKYFNKENKERMMKFGVLLGVVPELIDGLKLEGSQRSRMRTCDTHMKNVFEELIQSVDRAQCEQLKRAIHHHDIKISQSKPYSQEIEEEADNAFFDIVEVAQEAKCYGCTLEDVENCKLRIAMLNMSVPVVSEEYADGECPFYVEEI